MQAMFEYLQPPPRFYIKVDTDTLVLPHGLLRFLSGLAAATNRSSRLYFGNTAGICVMASCAHTHPHARHRTIARCHARNAILTIARGNAHLRSLCMPVLRHTLQGWFATRLSRGLLSRAPHPHGRSLYACRAAVSGRVAVPHTPASHSRSPALESPTPHARLCKSRVHPSILGCQTHARRRPSQLSAPTCATQGND